ncbi:hypothetical protein RB597_007823 [Gaeumannomyces tritici]
MMSYHRFLALGAALLAHSVIAAGLPQATAAGIDATSLLILTKAADAQVQAVTDGKAASLLGSPRGLTRQVRRLVTPFVWDQSSYYHNETLLSYAEDMLATLTERQHADGTFTVGNRHSPPDTGFLIEDFGVMITMLEADDHASSKKVAETIRALMAKAGPGLAHGGMHTPNHRWKLCSALARITHATGNSSYVSRIDDWLAEGIDIDADGIYSERSTIYYSNVANPSLLTVAHILNRTELVPHIRKNLELVIEHAEPTNGEVETTHSRRQDQNQRQALKDYYVQFRELALLDKNGRFAAMARLIERLFAADLGDFLGDLLERPELAAVLPAEEKAFVDFDKHYKASGLFRARRGKVVAAAFGGSDWYADGKETPFFNRFGSGLSTNPTLFRAWNGRAVLEAVRLAPEFFSMGHFRSNGLAYDNGVVRLSNDLKIPYYHPIPAEHRRADGVYAMSRSVDGRFYAALDFENRPAHTRDLKTDVRISPTATGYDLNFLVAGEENVDMTLELTFRQGGELSGVQALDDGSFRLVEGQGTYKVGEDTITFGNGNGAGPINTGAAGEQYSWHNGNLVVQGQHVYITGRSPLNYTLNIGFS